MIVFDQEKLSSLFGRIRDGYGASPLMIAGFAVVAVLFVLFLLVSYRIIRRRESRRLEAAIEAKNSTLFARFALDDGERELVDRLAAFLKDPRRRYLLLTDQAAFASCARKLLEAGDVSPDALASLRSRLGFTPRVRASLLRTTADLPPGLDVILDVGASYRTAGKVGRQCDDGVSVETVKPPESAVRAGDTAVLYLRDPRGVFAFETTVQRSGGSTVVVAHSDRLKHAQRRKYFRRRLRLEVVVKPEGGDGKPRTTLLLDLGGGGASLRNPGKELAKGDRIKLYLNRGEKDWLPLSGEVVRTSRNGAVAHIAFRDLSDAERDRIVRMVNRGRTTG